MSRLVLLLLAIALGCSQVNPRSEAERNACHVQANAQAERAWQAWCGDAEWVECPAAEKITEKLDDDLKSCDEEAYPDAD